MQIGMIEKRSKLWSTIRRAGVVNGRMWVVKSLCLGMGSGLVGEKCVIGLDLAWSGWFDRQWEPTIRPSAHYTIRLRFHFGRIFNFQQFTAFYLNIQTCNILMIADPIC